MQILTLKSLREKAVYTAPFQSTLNTEIQKHYNEHTSDLLTGVELGVIFSLLNNGGIEIILTVSWSWCKYNLSWLNYRGVGIDHTGW